MSKFEQYNIILRDLNPDETRLLEFDLDNVYFKKIDSPEVQIGNVKATVSVQKKTSTFELKFDLNGTISIPCDRCLDNMEQAIHYKEKLLVKFGAQFSEEDEIVIVPESDGSINIAWFLYEFIVLNIPMKHVHPVGECNKTMVVKLKKHIAHHRSDTDDEDGATLEFDDDDDVDVDFSSNETQTDPRWDGLQNISENN